MVTPEGVPVRFEVALAGDRAGALALDLLLIGVAVLAIALPLGWLAAKDLLPGDLVVAGLALATFLLRAFYFSFFELTWQGQTPGKRRLGIRAVDARGGPLTAEAILTRNLTREVEIFLPVMVLAGPEGLYPGAPILARILALAWVLLFGFLPFFNRDRLRVGDLLAGTIVVRTPAAVLLDDLTVHSAAPDAAAPVFTDAQLDVYGEYELQVLEHLLRRAGTTGHAESARVVAEKIRRKIGWEGPPGPDDPFLQTFYGALRARLERRMLFGKRRAHKSDRSEG